MEIYRDESEEPPPTTLCKPNSARVYPSPSNGGITRCREMAFIQHLSSPMLASRFRNDSFILASV